MMVDDTTIKLSSQEQGDPRRSQLAVSSNSRRPQITIQDIGIEELQTPGTFLILDAVDREAHIRCKAFKGYILYADTEEIFNVLYQRLRDDGEGYHHMDGRCSNKQTFFPRTRLEPSHANLELKLNTNITPHQPSSPASVSTNRNRWVFGKNVIQEPNRRLQEVNPDQWTTVSKNIDIPTLEFVALLESSQELAQLRFQVSTSALDENRIPIENTTHTIDYLTLFDNHHLNKPLKEIPTSGKEKLLQHQETIVTQLNSGLEDVITFLLNTEVLFPSEIEDLQREPANEQTRVTELFNILLNREGSLDFFIQALEETNMPTNIQIAKILRA